MGAGHELLRLDPSASVAGIIEAAANRGLPVVVLDFSLAGASGNDLHKLVLVRPVHHAAGRADAEPDDPLGLVAILRGAAQVPLDKSP